MKKFNILLLCFVFSWVFLKSQTELKPGDIAFVTMQTDNPDKFAFVTMVDILPGTSITFTDRSWGISPNNTNPDNWYSSNGEDTCIWFSGDDTIKIGSVILLVDSGKTDAYVIGGGYAVKKLGGLAATGDQIFAIQGSTRSPLFIAAVANKTFITTGNATTNNSYLPSTLILNKTAFVFSPLKDNGYFKADTFETAVDSCHSVVMNKTNWVFSDTIVKIDLPVFTLKSFIPEVPTFITSIENKDFQEVYPNPASTNIYFRIRQQNIELFNLIGKQIVFIKDAESMNISNISEGIYILRSDKIKAMKIEIYRK